MCECVIYQHGSSIFNNTNDERKKYRYDTLELNRFTVSRDEIYENKNVNRILIFIFKGSNRLEPAIRKFFVSYAACNRYCKENNIKLANKKDIDPYYIESLVFSYDDVRTK